MEDFDYVFREARASHEKTTLTMDFQQMGSGVTLTGTPSDLVVEDLAGVDSSPNNIVDTQPVITTATTASCALSAIVKNMVAGAKYKITWVCNRSDGDIAVAVTLLPAI